MTPPKKNIRVDAEIYYRLENIGKQMNPENPVPIESVIKILSDTYQPGVRLGGAAVISAGRGDKQEAAASTGWWAWVTPSGVRGALNMKTGAYQIPCEIRLKE